jgi:hypothetical protein
MCRAAAIRRAALARRRSAHGCGRPALDLLRRSLHALRARIAVRTRKGEREKAQCFSSSTDRILPDGSCDNGLNRAKMIR